MNTKTFPVIRCAGVLSAGLLTLAGTPLRAADKAESDAFPKFESYIKVTGQAASISGSETAFQNRAKQPSSGGAGVEDLHIYKDLSKITSLVIDGKALTGTEDYLGSFKLTKNEVGSIDVGYKRFRTFYDGVGGFFPLNSQWMPLSDQDLHVDRAKFWAEATLNVPKAPVFTLRYENDLRTGRKDSTIWGDTDFTGLPNNNAPISQVRKIVPSFVDLGERHESLEATMKHTIGQTKVQLSLLGDQFNNVDTRSVTRFPGEVRLFPTPAATVLVPAANMGNQVVQVETEGMKSKMSGVTAEMSTPLSSKLTLKINGNYELVHTAVSGDRPIVTSTPTATGVVPITTNNYANLAGGTRVKNYVGNVGVDWKPSKVVFAKVALRAQDEYIRGSSTYDVIAASGTPATALATTTRIGWAKVHQKVTTPVVELRYTGIKDVAVYFTGSKRDLNGVERNTSAYNPVTAAIGTLAIQNVSEDHGNYTLGASWKTSPFLTLRSEVYEKGHKDNTNGFETRVGDYYLLDSRYTGVKVTALARVSPQLGFTTRYVHQLGKMKVTGFLPIYPAFDSLNSKNHIISESIDWTPNKSFYAQVNGNVVFNVISTIYPRAGVTAATATAIAFDTNRVLQNSDNNYCTAGLLAGWVVAKDTDAQLQYNYYRANNGNAVLSAMTLPFGVAVKDTSVTLGLKHKFSATMLGNVKVGYFDSQNDTTGGRANYRGPLAYASIEHAF